MWCLGCLTGVHGIGNGKSWNALVNLHVIISCRWALQILVWLAYI